MQVRLWDPFTALARLDREFDELVRRTWGEPTAARQSVAGFVPPADLHTEGTDVVIRLELPGIDVEKDVTIQVHEGRLIINGERHNAREDTTGNTLVREMRYGSFRREFALPDGVAADEVSAGYDAGVLTVRVANVAKAPAEPVRVPIATGTPEQPAVIEGETTTS